MPLTTCTRCGAVTPRSALCTRCVSGTLPCWVCGSTDSERVSGPNWSVFLCAEHEDHDPFESATALSQSENHTEDSDAR